MAVFTYQAKGTDGKKVDGTIRALDRGAATAELKKRHLMVTQLQEQKAAARRGLFGPPRPHVKTKDIAVVTRQLSTMISAGIPLLESMEILHEQAADPGFKAVLDQVIERVRSGTDFSTALMEHPRCFSTIYVNMVRAGEAGGQLDTILIRLADYLESIEEIKREVRAALMYPCVSLSLILTITISLVVFVVPRFKIIFTQLKMDKLPMPTEVLLNVSQFMQDHYLLLGGILISIGVGFMMYIRTRAGQRQWHWFLLHMPIFGPLFAKVAISRFARTFSTLIQSGVPMLSSLDIVAGTAGNRIVEEAVLKAKDAVSKGDTLGDPLAATRVFPPMVTRMISIGEKTGALEKLLSKISEFYDAEVRAAVKALTSLIEPLLIAIMGILVGSIVLAIFLPIIELQKKLAG